MNSRLGAVDFEYLSPCAAENAPPGTLQSASGASCISPIPMRRQPSESLKNRRSAFVATSIQGPRPWNGYDYRRNTHAGSFSITTDGLVPRQFSSSGCTKGLIHSARSLGHASESWLSGQLSEGDPGRELQVVTHVELSAL